MRPHQKTLRPTNPKSTTPLNPAGGEVSARIVSTFSVAIPNALGSPPALELSLPDEDPPTASEPPLAQLELPPAPNFPGDASQGPGRAKEAGAGVNPEP